MANINKHKRTHWTTGLETHTHTDILTVRKPAIVPRRTDVYVKYLTFGNSQSRKIKLLAGASHLISEEEDRETESQEWMVRISSHRRPGQTLLNQSFQWDSRCSQATTSQQGAKTLDKRMNEHQKKDNIICLWTPDHNLSQHRLEKGQSHQPGASGRLEKGDQEGHWLTVVIHEHLWWAARCGWKLREAIKRTFKLRLFLYTDLLCSLAWVAS